MTWKSPKSTYCLLQPINWGILLLLMLLLKAVDTQIIIMSFLLWNLDSFHTVLKGYFRYEASFIIQGFDLIMLLKSLYPSMSPWLCLVKYSLIKLAQCCFCSVFSWSPTKNDFFDEYCLKPIEYPPPPTDFGLWWRMGKVMQEVILTWILYSACSKIFQKFIHVLWIYTGR